MPPRIALVHALRASIDPAAAAFARGWPSARTTNVLDDSLSVDVARAGGVDGDLERRFRALGRYCVSCGAEGVLFTCSAFDRAIARVREDLSVPVLAPTEAMVEEAIEVGGRIVVLATFGPTLASIRPELQRRAAERGAALELELVHVAGALQALARGDAEEHDELVAAAAAEAAGRGAELLALAQFSMARSAPVVRGRVRVPLLTTPDSAVAALRRLMGAG